jgi:hypothetical protein
MRHPLESIPISRRRLVLATLVVATGALMTALLLVDRRFPPGIVAFELAKDGDRARAMVDGWDATARAFVGFSLGLDYVYLCTYSSSIGLACIMLGAALRDRGAQAMASVAAPLAWGQWLAAVLDAIENATLLDTLTTHGPARLAGLSWGFACAKFALVALGLAFVIAAGCVVLLRRR